MVRGSIRDRITDQRSELQKRERGEGNASDSSSRKLLLSRPADKSLRDRLHERA